MRTLALLGLLVLTGCASPVLVRMSADDIPEMVNVSGRGLHDVKFKAVSKNTDGKTAVLDARDGFEFPAGEHRVLPTLKLNGMDSIELEGTHQSGKFKSRWQWARGEVSY